MTDLPPRGIPGHAELPPARRSFPALATLASGAIVIAALYFGRDVLIPFALALLLSFVLAPGVRWLRRLHVGRVTSVLIMVFFAFVVILSLGTVIASQITSLGHNLPLYESTIREKIRSVKDWSAGVGVIERVSNVLRDLNEGMSKPKTEEPPLPNPGIEAPHAGGDSGASPQTTRDY
jgi:predicted PurR-regulated permease PerM